MRRQEGQAMVEFALILLVFLLLLVGIFQFGLLIRTSGALYAAAASGVVEAAALGGDPGGVASDYTRDRLAELLGRAEADRAQIVVSPEAAAYNTPVTVAISLTYDINVVGYRYSGVLSAARTMRSERE